MRRIAAIVGFVCIFGLHQGYGRDVIEMESRYTGDGWFEYRLRTLEDPFFTSITFDGIGPYPFTNYVENTLPTHWTNAIPGAYSSLQYDYSVSQPRINEIVYSMRSSSTSFRRGRFGTLFELCWNGSCYFGDCIGGYFNPYCLVPCDATETDGSPATLVHRVELVPDIKIDDLIRTNDQIYGVKFSWNQSSTIQLEGTFDLTNWTHIARFFGNPPQSTWSTNVSLNGFGTFFRLSLVANQHITNALTLTSVASSQSNFENVPITSREFLQDQIRIGFSSVPDAAYEVDECELPGKVVATKQATARDAFTTVSFRISETRSFVFFKVRRLLK